MRTRILSFIIAALSLLQASAQRVNLYTDCGYRGMMVSLQPGSYAANQHGMRIRDLSSLQIPAGLAVNIFNADFFNGRYITLTSSTDCLANQGFNDQMVSVQVFRTDNYLQTNQSPVTIYERCNYGGRTEPLTEGSYAQLNMGFVRAQAIRVAPGFAVIFRKEVRQNGQIVQTDEEYRGDKNCLPLLWGANVKSAYVYRLGGVYDNHWNANTDYINSFNQGAVVYEHANYGGRAQVMPMGAYRGYQLDQVGGENVISSIRLSPGYRVTVFSGSNFDGASITFTSSIPNLGGGFGLVNWNDRISSMIVERTTGGNNGGVVIVNPQPQPNPNEVNIGSLPNDAVTIFSNPNLSGGKFSARVGAYRSNQILYIGPGTAQSIYVPYGYRMVAYTGGSLNGNSRVFYAGSYQNLSYDAPGWNRAINSFVVERWTDNNPPPINNQNAGMVQTGTPAVVFMDANYRGSSMALALGSYTTQQLGSAFVRSISSIQIAQGYRVVAYDGPNFSGDYRVLTYSIDNFAAEGQGLWNDRIQSLSVERADAPLSVLTQNVPSRPQPIDNNTAPARPQPTNNNPAPARPQPTDAESVVAYADVQFQGAAQYLPIGAYQANQLNGVGIRSISSMRVPQGYRVTVYDGPAFNGDYRVLTYTIDNLVSEGQGKWNDRIQSIIVERPGF